MIEGSYIFGSKKVDIKKRFKYLGKKKLNDLLSKTGINFIYEAKKNEDSLSLAIKVTKKILKQIKSDVECVIFISQSHRSSIPPSGALLHSETGLKKECAVFDLVQGCSSFPYALTMAINMINSKTFNNCLIISSEVYTKFIEKNNRSCASIFSDASSAIFLNKNNIPKILSSIFYTDGSGQDKLFKSNKNKIIMKGADVFTFTIKEVPLAVNKMLSSAKLNIDQIDMFFFHQASNIVLETLRKKLDIPKKKFFKNFSEIGNTVSSTIPISLIHGKKNNLIKYNRPIMILGFGVGYSLSGGIFSFDKK